jgi:hypothetical protein
MAVAYRVDVLRQHGVVIAYFVIILVALASEWFDPKMLVGLNAPHTSVSQTDSVGGGEREHTFVHDGNTHVVLEPSREILSNAKQAKAPGVPGTGRLLSAISIVGLKVASILVESKASQTSVRLLPVEESESGHNVFAIPENLGDGYLSVSSPGYFAAEWDGASSAVSLKPMQTLRIIGIDQFVGLKRVDVGNGAVMSMDGLAGEFEGGSCGMIDSSHFVAVMDVSAGDLERGHCVVDCQLSNGLSFGGKFTFRLGGEFVIDLASLGIDKLLPTHVTLNLSTFNGEPVSADNLDLVAIWLRDLGDGRRGIWSAMSKAMIEQAIPGFAATYARTSAVRLSPVENRDMDGFCKLPVPGPGHVAFRCRDSLSGSWYADMVSTSDVTTSVKMLPPILLKAVVARSQESNIFTEVECDVYVEGYFANKESAQKILRTSITLSDVRSDMPIQQVLPRSAADILYHPDLGQLVDLGGAVLTVRTPGCETTELGTALNLDGGFLAGDFGAVMPISRKGLSTLWLTEVASAQTISSPNGRLFWSSDEGTLLETPCSLLLGEKRDLLGIVLNGEGSLENFEFTATRVAGPPIMHGVVVMGQHEHMGNEVVLIPQGTVNAYCLSKNGTAITLQQTIPLVHGRVESSTSHGDGGELCEAVWALAGWTGYAGNGYWARSGVGFELSGIHAPESSQITIFGSNGNPLAKGLKFLCE